MLIFVSETTVILYLGVNCDTKCLRGSESAGDDCFLISSLMRNFGEQT